MLSQIPNPYGMEWQDWADTLVGFNPAIRSDVDPDDPWQAFAERLAQYASATPRPDEYENWENWAAALKQAYPS
jgi:hypothetical protein